MIAKGLIDLNHPANQSFEVEINCTDCDSSNDIDSLFCTQELIEEYPELERYSTRLPTTVDVEIKRHKNTEWLFQAAWSQLNSELEQDEYSYYDEN